MKRNEPTIVEKATQTVDGFAKVYKMLQQQVVLRGQSKSTLENYIRLIGQNKRAILLPSRKEEFKLPVILNRSELREIFLCTLYGTVMRPICWKTGYKS